MIDNDEIRNVVLEKSVLEAVSDLADFVRCYEPVFMYLVAKKNSASHQAKLRELAASVKKGEQRIKDLDRLIEKVYEDHALGGLSEERYHKMMAKYETEQKELTQKVEDSKHSLERADQQKTDLKVLLKALRDFTDIRTLTPEIVNKLISRIDIHQNDKSSGHCHVKVDIYFTAIGMIDIPTEKVIIKIMDDIKKNPQKYPLTA